MTVRKVQSDGKPEAKPGDRRGSEIEGVIGVIMDVTEVKAKEAVLAAQHKEKQQLLANEAAAKEASRLKSQFLANVSVESQLAKLFLADFLLDTDVPRNSHAHHWCDRYVLYVKEFLVRLEC